MKEIQDRLLSLQDQGYRAFQSRLIPTVSPDRIIGVRLPAIRALARDLLQEEPGLAAAFLEDLPHRYHDEDNLHIVLVNPTRDFELCCKRVEAFLPHLDNWATCDSLRPGAFKKNQPQVLPLARKWMESGHRYTVRFGIGCMMSYLLDGEFSPEHLELVGKVPGEEYYVRMMQAWYLATALAKQPRPALAYLARGGLDPWTHNKAIQKALESRRIPPGQKDLLRKLRR